MKIYSVVLMLVASVVVGCGTDAGPVEGCSPEECSTESTEQAALCCWCEIPPPGCGESPPPTGSGMKRFALGLWNAAPEARICHLSYNFTDADGAPVSGAVVSNESLPAQYWRGSSLETLAGSTVTMTAMCQHPSYPGVNVRATRTITTFPMDRARTCRAIYKEGPTPSMTIPCWEGPNVGPVPGIEFVAVIKNEGSSTATAGFGYFPAVDGGGTGGTEVQVLSGKSVPAIQHVRTGVFAPVNGVVKLHLAVTVGGVVRHMYADVAMDDPSVVTMLTIHSDGSVSVGESGF
jgi:hypothetical protein